MTQTIQQKIAETQARLQRLKTKAKADETRRKIITGSLVISNALKDPYQARALTDILRQGLTRDVDLKTVADLLDELDAKASEASSKNEGRKP